MTEIEITEIPPLKPDELCLLDMHSVLNVFNVLWSELTLIGLALENDGSCLSDSLGLLSRLVRALRDPVASLDSARDVEQHIQTFTAEIDRALARHPGARSEPEIASALVNLHAVFAVLRVRARELLARAGNREFWVQIAPATLQRELEDVLATIAKSSRGRYGIVYNAAVQGRHDYYVDLRFESDGSEEITLPLVLKDVMRDLIANARKYTAPGGHITAALHANRQRIRFSVSDNGRGIPAEELATVVHYGRRGTNVTDVRTMGGGFGLTKAFFVTKQFGGRFWIASKVGHGTRVRLEIPAQAALAQGR